MLGHVNKSSSVMKYDCQRAYLCGLTMNHIKSTTNLKTPV